MSLTSAQSECVCARIELLLRGWGQFAVCEDFVVLLIEFVEIIRKCDPLKIGWKIEIMKRNKFIIKND